MFFVFATLLSLVAAQETPVNASATSQLLARRSDGWKYTITKPSDSWKNVVRVVRTVSCETIFHAARFVRALQAFDDSTWTSARTPFGYNDNSSSGITFGTAITT